MRLPARTAAGTVSASQVMKAHETRMRADANGGDDGRSMRMRTRGAERARALRLLRLRHHVLPRVHHSPGVGDLLPRLRGVAAGDARRARGGAVRGAVRHTLGER